MDDEKMTPIGQMKEEYDLEDPGPSRGALTSQSGTRQLLPLSLHNDPVWGIVDLKPDIQFLFKKFNSLFFAGQLEDVKVSWSKRMTKTAGLCCYNRSTHACSIKLSQPMLSLQTRKDLVEILLHEMIHAYLRINGLTGTNITICNDVYDVLDQCKKHWWRCNGPCQHQGPKFGYIKRSMNREPSAQEKWFQKHQETCGGKFIKVIGPETTSRKRARDGEELNAQPPKRVKRVSQISHVRSLKCIPSNTLKIKLIYIFTPFISFVLLCLCYGLQKGNKKQMHIIAVIGGLLFFFLKRT
uniref:SprT-like domain-containing protein n=1 Tax=Leptobrachium leishanense TaxID=445787 RepID=A0A8C5QQZ7_9ANUR